MVENKNAVIELYKKHFTHVLVYCLCNTVSSPGSIVSKFIHNSKLQGLSSH